MLDIKKLFVLLFVVIVKLSAYAQVKLPALVGNNMVLQQNEKVNLWGWAAPNEKIKIQLGWKSDSIEITAEPDGTWKTTVETPKGGEKKYTIALEASNKIILQNVLIGEVWICSGQSNMYFPVGKEDKTWKTDRKSVV